MQIRIQKTGHKEAEKSCLCLYIVNCTLYSVQFTVCTVYSYNVQCTLYSVPLMCMVRMANADI
jgi:hypothetical protein